MADNWGMVWTREGYELIGLDASYVLRLPGPVELLPESLSLKSGDVLAVGDEVLELRGQHSSAGYIQFKSDTPITYHGIYQCQDGDLACFTQPATRPYQLRLFDSGCWYFAWVWIRDLQMFGFATKYVASRIIETEICELRKREAVNVEQTAQAPALPAEAQL